MRIKKLSAFSACLAALLSIPQLGYSQDAPDFSIDFDEVVAIIGGQDTLPGRFPSTTALLRVSPTQSLFQRQFCGGTAISDSHVLTAAHCLFNAFGQIDPDELLIAGNFVDLANDSPAEIEVAQIFVHPGYDNRADLAVHDIAILRTTVPHNIPPITLFTGNSRALTGEDAFIAGWGVVQLPQFQGDSVRFPSVLQEATVPVTDFATCNRAYGNQLNAAHVCAGFQEGGVDSCQGDSGGPLMIRVEDQLLQIGVTSFGNGCALPNAFGVYSNIETYQSFIARIVPPPSNGKALFGAPDQFQRTVSSSSSDDDDGSFGLGLSGPGFFIMLALGGVMRVIGAMRARREKQLGMRRVAGAAIAALLSTGCALDLPAPTEQGSQFTATRSTALTKQSPNEGGLIKASLVQSSDEHKDLPMFDGAALSEKRASVITAATERYGVEPVCAVSKVAPTNSKKADLYERCDFTGFAKSFKGGTIQSVTYHLMSGRVVQIDAVLHGAAVAMAPMANTLDKLLGESVFSVGETKGKTDGAEALPQAVYHWSDPAMAYARLMTEAGADTESFLLSIQHPKFTDVIAELPAL